MTGWICPVCGEANSPFMNACVNAPHAKVVSASTTNDLPAQCTCASRPWGLEPTTAVCPVHGPNLKPTTWC